jgi:MoxR-like ATPase
MLARPLQAEPRVVDYLIGQDRLDERLEGAAKLIDPSRRLEDLELPASLLRELSNAGRAFRREGAILFLVGPAGVGKRSAAEAVSGEQQRRLLAADLSRTPLPAAETLALLEREAVLCDANLLLEHIEKIPAENAGFDLAPRRRLIFVAGDDGATECPVRSAAPLLRFDFPIPAFEQRVRLWRRATGAAEEVDAAALANKYVLTAGEIEAATLRAARYAAIRSQSNQALRLLAQKVSAAHEWHDLILPPRPLQQLREVCASYRRRSQVYSAWGFERRLSLGKGLNVLFCGPSGTGKTMAAGVLARDLGLDMYKIDLSTVVSKYIGETEKQLSRIFRQAQSSNAILFFDEADALFGKRSEVKDAHDRYANVETAYLLQKMEEYEGVVILATNFRKNMDDAFVRRMHHIVEFPPPDAEARERIWRGMLPPGAPVAEDLDFRFVARQFELAGGSIRNIVLAAAFLAADEGRAIHMEHLILATSRELQKMGRLPSRAEFREYFETIRGRC